MIPELVSYCQATQAVDSDNPAVMQFARENMGGSPDPGDQAVNLYYAIRDGIRYDPYTFDLTIDSLKASTTLKTKKGWCVPKAVLLAACCRAVQIPARLGFADVRNHLSTARMRELMKTDIFRWHGYTSMYLNGKWVKATPAFNIELCNKIRIRPLDFDGCSDSIFHPFDLDGKLHMEYLSYRGEFHDVPLDQIRESLKKEYLPDSPFSDLDFEKEIDGETTLYRS